MLAISAYTSAACRFAAACLAAAGSVAVLADGSAWLPPPGTTTFGASYVSQSADNLWAGTNKVPIPFKGLEQRTVQLDAAYGISDAFALDASVGLSEVEPTHGRPIPLATEGRTDLNLGLTWRLYDEVVGNGPSFAVRAGLILQGDYEAGGPGPVEVMGDPARVGVGPTALGDGSDGIEVSAIIGRVFGERLAVSGELGRRIRNSDVPAETFVNVGAHVFAGSGLVLSGQYHVTRSAGDLDIGPPPSPGKHGRFWHRFPHVAEDVDRVALGGTYALTDSLSVGAHWYKVLDGRNTADFKAVAGSVTYSFGE